MKRLPFILAIMLVLLTAAPLGISAQAQAPDIGTAVAFVDNEGNELGSITVTGIDDPATGLDPDFPAEADSRYVVLTVVFEAAADRRFDIDPFAIVVQDGDGALWSRTAVRLAEDAVVPELGGQALAPGSRISGVVGFALPDAAEVARVFYQPESNRLITLAEVLGVAPPPVGQVFEIADGAGGTGQVAVLDVFDPFLDFDPGSPPEPGNRYLMLWLVLENVTPAIFQPSSSWFVVRDDAGYLWSTGFVPRPTEEPGSARSEMAILDLDSQRLGSGDRLSRAIFFQLPEDAVATAMYVRPDSSYLIAVADLADVDAAATPVSDDED